MPRGNGNWEEEKRSRIGTTLGKVLTSASSQRSQRDLWGPLAGKVLLGEKQTHVPGSCVSECSSGGASQAPGVFPEDVPRYWPLVMPVDAGAGGKGTQKRPRGSEWATHSAPYINSYLKPSDTWLSFLFLFFFLISPNS